MSDQPTSLFLLTEAAERTGLTVDALRKRIRRGKLEVVKGNDGLVRVRLTSADLEALRLGDGRTGWPEPSASEENTQAMAALEAERDAARLAAATAEGEAKALRDALGREQQRADKAEGESATLREQVESARARAGEAERGREDARVKAAASEAEAKALREALALMQRPFWRRWLGQ
jgi:hypothetical protein